MRSKEDLRGPMLARASNASFQDCPEVNITPTCTYILRIPERSDGLHPESTHLTPSVSSFVPLHSAGRW
jgi:hypothetical protein